MISGIQSGKVLRKSGGTDQPAMKTSSDDSGSNANPVRSNDRLFWLSASVLVLIAIGLLGLILYDRWQQQNDETLEMTISPQASLRVMNSDDATSSALNPPLLQSPAPAATLTQALAAEATSTQELAATPAQSGEGEPAATDTAGGQHLTTTELRDDFSTSLLGWSEAEREDSRRGYLPEGEYFIEVSAPGVFALSFVPVEFSPALVEFTARVSPESVGGTYGVLCQYGDENNFYLVEVNPFSGELAIGARRDAVYTALTDPEWQPAPSFVVATGEANRFAVTCTPSEILVIVNGQEVARQVVSSPLPSGLRLALFAAGYEGLLGSSFRVILDDIFAQAAAGEFR